MDSSKLSVKFFVDGNADVAHDVVVPIFHGWIQRQGFPDHLLIDVADYAHVPNGPGTLLVSHEANIHMDREDGLGLLYVRKQSAGDSLDQRVQTVFRNALRAAATMEAEPSLEGKVKFRTDRIVLKIHDRLNAPNTPQTFEAVKPALQKYLDNLYGSPVTFSYKPDPERLFQIDIAAKSSPDVKSLLDRASV